MAEIYSLLTSEGTSTGQYFVRFKILSRKNIVMFFYKGLVQIKSESLVFRGRKNKNKY
jgi:hypothetical protein